MDLQPKTLPKSGLNSKFKIRYIMQTIISIITFLAAAIAFAYLRAKYLHTQILRRYAQRFENIYVISRHFDGSKPELGFLDEFCVFAPHRRVLAIAEEELELLKESGNKFLLEDVEESAKIKVITIIFRDGYVNESWEQFQERAAAEIMKDREVRHGELRGNINWYNLYHNQQIA